VNATGAQFTVKVCVNTSEGSPPTGIAVRGKVFPQFRKLGRVPATVTAPRLVGVRVTQLGREELE
jgi:hypothetical protein